MHWAAKGGHAKIAKFLIDQGANKVPGKPSFTIASKKFVAETVFSTVNSGCG